eukprot:gene15156-17359_t
MSVKSFLLDFGLPGLAALGVGLTTYMLTGGPEEFPESTVAGEATNESEDGCRLEEDLVDEDGRILDETKSTPPTWVLDIVAQTKSMAEELRLLKEATQHQTQQQSLQFQQLQELQRHFVCEDCKESAASKKVLTGTETSKEVASDSLLTVAPVEKDWLLLVRHAVWQMASNCADSSQSAESLLVSIQQYNSSSVVTEKEDVGVESSKDQTKTDFAAASDLLLMYINNIVKNPTVPRYRRLATTNNSYLKSLSAVQGHVTVLASVGFIRKPESNSFEYEWHNLPATPDGKNKSDRPNSSQDAANLLKEAVELLTALKSGVDTLGKVLVEKITNSSGDNRSSAEKSESTSAVVDSEIAAQTSTASTITTVGVSPIVDRNPQYPFATANPEDDLVSVSVVEVSEQESLSGDGEAAAAVDFMQILKKAQESRSKAV